MNVDFVLWYLNVPPNCVNNLLYKSDVVHWNDFTNKTVRVIL